MINTQFDHKVVSRGTVSVQFEYSREEENILLSAINLDSDFNSGLPRRVQVVYNQAASEWQFFVQEVTIINGEHHTSEQFIINNMARAIINQIFQAVANPQSDSQETEVTATSNL